MTSQNVLLTSIITLLLSTATFAQQLDHVLGEFLIQPSSIDQIDLIVKEFDRFEGKTTDLAIDRKIQAPMPVYVLTFDFGQIHERRFLSSLQRHSEVVFAQFNHIIKLRATVPDDELFTSQWQYINTGANGGTPGADIDADLAWDITTGGLTPSGDTIVAAVLDDGIDQNHEDFDDNLWVNHDEIPDNGIDDDNNGYVDDYLGWNSNTDDDFIGGGGHGTPVAGIIGAQGNNGIGVAGVNWDVKVMVIKNNFNTNEANVISAYSYPYFMRKRYNETQGDSGAFVVVTNASWGVDFGDPADAPIWCSFYDSLGQVGIISCGATINGNQNVDVIGDLPTACPSDYLISVTNMNRNDVKVNGAGYGATTIDLGAFGAQTFTTDQGNTYGGFGGTSGATPHVAGAVALLYSAPCSEIGEMALSHPAHAAELVRRYVLEGVDPNASLDGITTTGGRLNLFNSLELVLNNCGPCPAPSALATLEVVDTTALVEWFQTDSTETTELRYRAVGATEWDTIAGVSSPYLLGDLLGCSMYEMQIKSFCADTTSTFSESLVFETDGCCTLPENIAISTIANADTLLQLSWDPIYAAESYELRILDSATGVWTTYMLTEPNFSADFLNSCSSYGLQIQTVCGPDSTSIDIFETAFDTDCPCDFPPMIDTISVSTTNAQIFWSSTVNNDVYNVRYKKLGTASWTIVPVADTTYLLEDLEICSNYQIQVQNICPTVASSYSPSYVLKTDCNPIVNTSEQIAGASMRVLGNPFSNQLVLEMNWTNVQEAVSLEIFDVQGKQLWQQNLDGFSGNNQQVRIPTTSWSSGLYFVRVRTDRGSSIQRVVKQ